MRVCAAGAVVLSLSGTAWAQEDLEQGKNAPQLFASDCGICHNSAQALVKDGYPTEAFLRVHYTSSREMASALFTYLRGLARADAANAGPSRRRTRKRRVRANLSAKRRANPGSLKRSPPKTPRAPRPRRPRRPRRKISRRTRESRRLFHPPLDGVVRRSA